MTDEDLGAVRRLLLRHPWLRPASVVAPTGEGHESDLCRELYGVPAAQPARSEWDLMDPPPAGCRGAGLAVVCNAFLCSVDPARWLANLALAAPFLVLQDLSDARRGPGTMTDPAGGDVARYSVSSHGVIGATDPGARPVLDLSDPGSTGGALVLDCEPYMPTGRGTFVRFAALLDLRRVGVGAPPPEVA